ncbi:MAG: sulfatase [Planctomycetes bacterium]|nr:sulfatase [Planctomycetota bacterium]
MAAAPPATAQQPPNVILIFTDDQGYGDLSCYGHPTIATPCLDALAAGGMRLMQFYVASPVCSPSRAALMTGCYPKRVGMHRHVVFPQYDYGLHTDEMTLADLLHGRGYATGCFGKWHLGHRPGLLPLDQGFDVYAGVPYSNDMAQMHRPPDSRYAYRLPWIEGDKVVEWEPDQHLLTQRITRAAVQFIETHRDQRFFCYVPHSMPHIPLYASERFAGRSRRGLYGDVIEEIDHGVGELVATVDRLGLRDRTLILFTSDNGPWLQFKQDGGSAGLLRGGKGTNWEGGQRVPCIANWPGTIPAGAVCTEIATTMDLLPTIATLAGADLRQLPAIDGHDIAALLRAEPEATSPTPHFLYYTAKGELAGIRRGPWKLLFEGGLFHLEHDVSEQWDRSEQQPELRAELTQLARDADAAITANMRPVRHVEAMLFDPAKPPR